MRASEEWNGGDCPTEWISIGRAVAPLAAGNVLGAQPEATGSEKSVLIPGAERSPRPTGFELLSIGRRLVMPLRLFTRWHHHLERRQEHVNLPAQLVDAMVAAVRARVAAADVIAVVGKLFAGRESRGFADDPVALDHEPAAIGVQDDPFAAEQGDGVRGGVVDRDKVDEGVGFVRGKAGAAMVIAEFIEPGRETGQFLGGASHDAK